LFGIHIQFAILSKNEQRFVDKHRRTRVLLEPVTAIAQAYSKEGGLSVDWSNPHSTLSPLAWVTQCPGEFDFGCAPDFPQFHYAGPFHDGRGRMDFDFPWQQLTGGKRWTS